MRRTEGTLLDIHRAGTLALEFVAGVADAQAFAGDAKTRAAVLHELLVLGEAVKRLPTAFRDHHGEIPWRNMAGLRDVLIHAYDDVDDALVQQVLTDDLPAVLSQIGALLPTPQCAAELRDPVARIEATLAA